MDYNLKFAFAIVFLIVFGVALQSAHCATSSPRRDNSLGVVISSDNPLMYNMGFMAHGQIIEDEKGREYTSIDFAPIQPTEYYTGYAQPVTLSMIERKGKPTHGGLAQAVGPGIPASLLAVSGAPESAAL